jgi:general secretion pathway protein I
MNQAGRRLHARAGFSRGEMGSRGFTLMEALVALTIVSMMIAAIANLTNSTLRGVVHVERSLAEVEIARQLVVPPPASRDVAVLSSTGRLDGHVWRFAAEPFRAPFPVATATPHWVPAKIELSVRGNSGALFKVEMVRLVRPRTP